MKILNKKKIKEIDKEDGQHVNGKCGIAFSNSETFRSNNKKKSKFRSSFIKPKTIHNLAVSFGYNNSRKVTQLVKDSLLLIFLALNDVCSARVFAQSLHQSDTRDVKRWKTNR